MINIEEINEAVDAAYDAALLDPQDVAAEAIAENVTLGVKTYETPEGSGFWVVCRIEIPEYHCAVSRCRAYGPAAWAERDWPEGGVEEWVKAHVARCIAAGAAHVVAAGFGADEKVILLNKLLRAREEDALDEVPKLLALHAWMEQVQADAVAGLGVFAAAPYTFAEGVAE